MKEKLYGPLFEWLNEKGISTQEAILGLAVIWFTYRAIMKIKYWNKENPSVLDKYDYISDIIIIIGLYIVFCYN